MYRCPARLSSLRVNGSVWRPAAGPGNFLRPYVLERAGLIFFRDNRGAKSYDSAMTLQTWQKYSEWPLVGAAFIFLAAYSILVIVDPPEPYSAALTVLIWSTWAAFGVDYIVKLSLAPHRGRWFIRHPMDLLMVVLPVARPLRLLRPFTLRKVMARAPGTAIRTRVMAYVVASALILIYTVALSVLSFEKGAPNANITTMGDSLWWAIVTITTIGYGDFYPVTVPGRWAAAALMIGGFAVLSMVTAAVSSWLVESVTAATQERTKDSEPSGAGESPGPRTGGSHNDDDEGQPGGKPG
jgi:voltage-gated potassium channel